MEQTWIKLHYSEHDSMLIKAFTTFCEKEDYLDVTFVCNNGKKMLASKLVLSCISPFLKSILSEWEGNDEMITLLLPGVDYNILKLILDFVYEGIMKLSENEYKDFMQLLQMLQIILPGATVIERNVLSTPLNPPPPVAKLQKKTVTMNASNSMEKKPDIENDKRENSSAIEEKPRRSSEPDDDPLNVPDYYYVPSTLTGGSNQAHIKNAANLNTNNMKEVQVKSDLNVDTHQEANNSSTLQQDGKSTRKRTHPRSNLEKESYSNVAEAKRSLGRRGSALDREGSTDFSGNARKRLCANTSSESDNSSDISSGAELNRRKQSFAYSRGDSNDTVTFSRTKSKKT